MIFDTATASADQVKKDKSGGTGIGGFGFGGNKDASGEATLPTVWFANMDGTGAQRVCYVGLAPTCASDYAGQAARSRSGGDGGDGQLADGRVP